MKRERAKKGAKKSAVGLKSSRGAAAMVRVLRREVVRIAEGVTFGVKLGGGVDVIFSSLAEFRSYEGRVIALPPPWFTEFL